MPGHRSTAAPGSSPVRTRSRAAALKRKPKPQPAEVAKVDHEDLADILGITFDTLEAFRKDVERNLLADGELEYDPLFTEPRLRSVRVLPSSRQASAEMQAAWAGAQRLVIYRF